MLSRVNGTFTVSYAGPIKKTRKTHKPSRHEHTAVNV